MNTGTIEHWIGVIAPAFPPETCFAFHFEPEGVSIEAGCFPSRPSARPESVRVYLSRKVGAAYENAGELVRGAADVRILRQVTGCLQTGEERCKLDLDELGLARPA